MLLVSVLDVMDSRRADCLSPKHASIKTSTRASGAFLNGLAARFWSFGGRSRRERWGWGLI